MGSLTGIEKVNNEIINLKKEVAFLKSVMQEELVFIRRTEEAWGSYDKGEFVSVTEDNFLEELEKC